MDTVVDRLIRYAKVYSESDYHAGRTVTPSTDRQFDMAKLLVEELHGLGIENRDPAFRGSAEMEDGIVVCESREGPSGGYEYVRSFSLVGGECLAVIEGEEGIVSGTAPRETYDFVASYFEA